MVCAVLGLCFAASLPRRALPVLIQVPVAVPRTQPAVNRQQQPAPANRQPQVVRTIPVKIEGRCRGGRGLSFDGGFSGEEANQPYVHPSQQTQVPEPKKYTGSSIPSRSFKILQAMTAPDGGKGCSLTCFNRGTSFKLASVNTTHFVHGQLTTHVPSSFTFYGNKASIKPTVLPTEFFDFFGGRCLV